MSDITNTPPPQGPPTKWYHAKNATRRIRAGGVTLEFKPYALIGGCWFGALETNDPEKVAALDALVEDKLSGVTALTQVEYLDIIKKNPTSEAPTSFQASPPRPKTGSETRVAESRKSAVVVENPGADLAPPATPPGEPVSADAALVVGEITPVSPVATPPTQAAGTPTTEQ